MTWYRSDPAHNIVLTVHIQPGAKRTEVVGLHGDALKIKLAAAPIEGKANAALLKFLAKKFKVSGSQVTLKYGAKSRHKVIEIKQSNCKPNILFQE